jgi:hypothetical protein
MARLNNASEEFGLRMQQVVINICKHVPPHGGLVLFTAVLFSV